ncbi:hypothetical protein TYRP_005602 [Tyrophagus putrescentiae]|nr:hypothetical protein TYRP_005602 [Tyrophagus putrescentiae]
MGGESRPPKCKQPPGPMGSMRRAPLLVGVADVLNERPQFVVGPLRQRIVVGQLAAEAVVPAPDVRVGGEVELDGHLEQRHRGEDAQVGDGQVVTGDVVPVDEEDLEQGQGVRHSHHLLAARGAVLAGKLIVRREND